MTTKLKALTVWIAMPFLTAYVLVPYVVSILRREPLWGAVTLGQLVTGLAYCAIPAAVGTGILWKMRVRAGWSTILIGAILSVALVFLMGYILMVLYPGFETGAGIYTVTLLVSAPSGFAGAWAGYLRSRAVAR